MNQYLVFLAFALGGCLIHDTSFFTIRFKSNTDAYKFFNIARTFVTPDDTKRWDMPNPDGNDVRWI